MYCHRCGSNNVIVQAVTHTESKRMGCLAFLLWIALAFLTFGAIIILYLLVRGANIKSRTETVALCQNCGYRWKPGWRDSWVASRPVDRPSKASAQKTGEECYGFFERRKKLAARPYESEVAQESLKALVKKVSDKNQGI